MGKIRVFLADDQALVRSGFRMLIEAEDDLIVVGEASDGDAAIRALLADKNRTADDGVTDVQLADAG